MSEPFRGPGGMCYGCSYPEPHNDDCPHDPVTQLEAEVDQLRAQLAEAEADVEHWSNRASTMDIDAGRRHVENLALRADLKANGIAYEVLNETNVELMTENDALRAEVERLKGNAETDAVNTDWTGGEIDRLRAALRKYGTHTIDCRWARNGACGCDWAAEHAALNGAGKKED
jgi:hypothetical protein